MARKSLILAFGVALCLLVGSDIHPLGGDQPSIGREIQQKVIKNYPNHKIVNWCSGKFAGRELDAVVVLRNPAKKEFLVLWVMSQGGIQELDSVPQTDATDFELECLNAKDAKQLQDTLEASEGISSSVKIPEGSGAVCYFIDEAIANCWSLDSTSGRLVRVGAWET